MMRQPVFDKATEMAWVILAVARFGSVGDRVQIGAALEKGGFIQATKDGHSLTPKGQDWVNRLNSYEG